MMIVCDFISSMVKLHNLCHFYLDTAYQKCFIWHHSMYHVYTLYARVEYKIGIVIDKNIIYYNKDTTETHHIIRVDVQEIGCFSIIIEIQIRVLS